MDSKTQLRLILKTLKALEEGAVTTEEAQDICKAGGALLAACRPHVTKYWGKLALDSAGIVLKDLSEKIGETTKKEEDGT